MPLGSTYHIHRNLTRSWSCSRIRTSWSTVIIAKEGLKEVTAQILPMVTILMHIDKSLALVRSTWMPLSTNKILGRSVVDKMREEVRKEAQLDWEQATVVLRSACQRWRRKTWTTPWSAESSTTLTILTCKAHTVKVASLRNSQTVFRCHLWADTTTTLKLTRNQDCRVFPRVCPISKM